MTLKRSVSQKLRMEGRDYSRAGWYFVTLGADYHTHLFGSVVNGVMVPNILGKLVERCWAAIPQHYGHIELGAWQVMPNHFHGLVRIRRAGIAGLGEVLNLFKGSVTREARREGLVGSRHGEKVPRDQGRVWAPNYYDVICFNSDELAVREHYIQANPKRWALRDIPVGMIRQCRFKGNPELLKVTKRLALRVSRRAKADEVDNLKAELALLDGVVCSTFFSPGERDCLEYLLANGTRVIWVMPFGMHKKISERWISAFLCGKALWLSAFPDDQIDATRESCEKVNRWVEQFCSVS